MTLSDELARCWEALNDGDPNAFLDLYDPEIVTFVTHWSGRGKRSGLELDGLSFGVMSFQEGRIVSIVHLGGAFGSVDSPRS